MSGSGLSGRACIAGIIISTISPQKCYNSRLSEKGPAATVHSAQTAPRYKRDNNRPKQIKNNLKDSNFSL